MLKINKKQLSKLCSIITAACFSVTILSNNIFAVAEYGTVTNGNKYFASYKSIISEKYGKVTSYNDLNSDTVVINIQDLHCDYGVQKNIASLIKELDKQQNNIKNIYVEGGFGNIDTSFFSNLDKNYRNKVLENLLKSGNLTGAEYYSVISGKTGFLKGIENKELHEENIARLVNILNDRNTNLKYLSNINREIDFLKAKYLSSNNKKFNEIISKYENGEIRQDKYFRYLSSYLNKNRINMSKYPNLSIYLGLSQNGKNLDFDKVTAQLERVVQIIKNSVSYEEYNSFLNATDNLTDVLSLKKNIELFCQSENISLNDKYPDLYKFLSLKNKAVSFNPLELVKEERNLTDVVRTYLSEDQTDLEIAYLSDFQKYFSGYLTSSLTAAQWEYFKTGIDKFKELYAKYSISNDVAKLDKEFEQLNKFYEVNTDRNNIFVDNMGLGNGAIYVVAEQKSTPAEMLKNAKNIVILVAGGYHTSGVNKILNDKNISNITITPNVLSASSVLTKQNYEFIAKQQTIQNQTIALGLLSNATQREQIRQIVGALFSGQNLDGVNISILVEQLNQLFGQKIKVTNLIDENKLEFAMPDGNSFKIDVNENVSRIINEQNLKEMPSLVLAQVTGDKLNEIANLVLKTTFNMGQEIFAPQIYKISKEVCVFMVKNKWYLGNGAVWDIANSGYSGQTLDGVDPVIYEYMPEVMQNALLNKENNNNPGASKKAKQSLVKTISNAIRTVILPILLIIIMLSSTGCSIFNNANNTPTPTIQIGQTIDITDSERQFQQTIENKLDEFNGGNGFYSSFIYEDMSEENQSTLNPDQKRALKNIQNLYDQALVALSYMQMGEIEKAEKVLTAISGERVLYKSNMESTQSTGENVWVGIAAEQYKILTGSNKFDDLITKVDKYLYSISMRDGSYAGQKPYASWVSTEHMLDIIAYYNLRTVYDSSDEIKQKLMESSEYVYKNLYIESEGRLKRGADDNHSVLDVCSWGAQVLTILKQMNPEIYQSSGLKNIDIDKLLEYAENNFKTSVSYSGVEYNNLYRWSNETTSPVSFEWTMQMAVTYNMLGNTGKANAIMADVKAYSKALGFDDSIPYSNVNNTKNYSNYGWDVFVVPAVCTTIGQAMQVEFGSFFAPLTKIEDVDYTPSSHDGKSIFVRYSGTWWRSYTLSSSINLEQFDEITFKIKLLNNENKDEKVMIQLLPTTESDTSDYGLYYLKRYTFDSEGNATITITHEDFKKTGYNLIDLSDVKVIVIAGERVFTDNLNGNKQLNLDIYEFNVLYNDGTTKKFIQIPAERNNPESSKSTEQTNSSPGSILPETFGAVNDLILKGEISMWNMLKEILKKETFYSIIHPVKFVLNHKTQPGQTGAKAVVYSTFIAAFTAFNILLFTAAPVLLIPLISLITGLMANITTHTLIDYFYLKSSGLQEAVRLYGSEKVKFSESGKLNIADSQKAVPMFVINDKPSNFQEFDFKPISVKFKSKDGKEVKGWLGRYKGASVLFADGANYEDIVNNFRQTRQFSQSNKKISANVDIIEIDLNNPDSDIKYSKSGNPLAGLNALKTNNIIDIQKEVSLLNNKKVEAITINQNIALFIDDNADNIMSYNDLLSSIELYVKNDNLGTDSKILFTDKYLDRIIQLIRQDVSKDAKSKEEIEKLTAEKFMQILKEAKSKNKDISVVFDQPETTDFNKYFQYGIFSYVANGKYFDSVSGTDVNTKIVTNFDQVQGFDGSISIIKVSLFKDKIAKSSGIFTFLNSAMNIKEMLEKRSVDFVRQTANNFDFNQIPQISDGALIDIIKAKDTDKYSLLAKYINDASSIAMYYNGLKNANEKEIFINTLLERMLAVNLLRQKEAYEGLKDHRLEEILAKALTAKYINNIDSSLKYEDFFSVNDSMTASEVEQKLLERVSFLTNEAFNKNSPQAINEIIEILPLYADRNTELRTTKVELINVQNIRGILSAA
ncbi:MAG: hypothetical protein VB017_02245 [Endomicrobiaceae bacterium]|nr:hypothetical protein [Endomicrobiaceae bacterium]